MCCRTASPRPFFELLMLVLCAAAPAAAQNAMPAAHELDEAVVAPGQQLKAGGIHRWLLGSHHRTLWTTPIVVPVLDLQTYAGGLTPMRVGGGMQTRSLRFQGANGREYVFRSLEKDPTQKLPPELRETIAGRISRDQVSAMHPAGALVASPLLAAAGVLHADPVLLVLPRDQTLARFGADFPGALGTFEERSTSDADSLADGRQVIGSSKLLERLDQSARQRVDTRAFLTARLMDLYLGDWDRHLDQWRWVRRRNDPAAAWQPIPRDRDYAFSHFDGLLLSLVRHQQPQWVKFESSYPSIFGLTWYGRALDRRLLTGLEWPAWDSVAHELQRRLSDSVIDQAIGRLPPEMRQLSGAGLRQALIGRRERLPQAARDFYRLLARDTDVHATDESNRVRVVRDGRALTVDVFSDSATAEPAFHRRFVGGETREVRLYLGDGDDQVDVTGQGGGPLVRIVGGAGADRVVDSSRGGRVRVYDVDSGTRVEGRRQGGVDRRPYHDAEVSDSIPFPPRNWGTEWRPLLWVAAEPELGLFLGGGAVRYGYGFRNAPYASKTQARLGYATGASALRAEFRHQAWMPNSRTSYKLLVRASGLELFRFYGFGNETPRAGTSQFHRVPQQQYTVAPSISFGLGRSQLSLGPVLKYSDTELEPNRFITLNPPLGTGKYGQVGVQSEWQLDGRDLPGWPRRGGMLSLGASLFPKVWDVERTFGEVHGEASAYLSPAMPLHPTLALRAGGKRVWGTYPFHEAAYLGSPYVRGLHSARYAGDASAYGSAELRLPLFRPYIVVPGEFGVLGFTDVGRVFLDGETSDVWHTGVGGGVWFSFLQRANTLTLAVARGDDRTAVYFRAGFGY